MEDEARADDRLALVTEEPALRALARRLVADDDAEDLVQETLATLAADRAGADRPG